MTQLALHIGPFGDYPDLGFREGSQNDRVYKRLQAAPVKNSEIIREMGIFNSTGRVSDIRKALESHGLTVQARPIGGGVFEYRIA